jgi:hypothetical protein
METGANASVCPLKFTPESAVTIKIYVFHRLEVLLAEREAIAAVGRSSSQEERADEDHRRIRSP